MLIKKIFNKILKFAVGHKIKFGMIVLAFVIVMVLCFGLFKKDSTETKYVLASVQKGSIISSVSGTGQVSVLNQVEVKPKASGDVVYVGVKNGQEVKKGALLVQLNTKDALKAIRDAEINLENSQITLEKLKVSQGQSIPDAQDSISTAEYNLKQSYQSGFNEVSNSFLNLPTILDGIRGILYDSTVGTAGQTNTGAYQDLMDSSGRNGLKTLIIQAENDYSIALSKYNTTLSNYRNTTRDSSDEEITELINETLETSKAMAQAVKDEQNILDIVVASLRQYQASRQIPSAITTYQSNISSYVSKLNSYISSLSSAYNSINANIKSLANAKESLTNLEQDNPLDLASQQNQVEQKEAALQDAKDALLNYYVRAPFDGVIAEVSVEKGDSASSGTSVATLITNKKVAQISLNEVDIAKIKVGQKATLTFDAISDLTITGEVSNVDALGTVSQGVVTYEVQIGFDTQDERIKSGMSASASIITDSKQDVLVVSSSAIKSSGDISYVLIPQDSVDISQLSGLSTGIILSLAPRQQVVEIGLSNDSSSEITSGLNEGDVIVTKTLTSSTSSTTSSSKSSTQSNGGFSSPGGMPF